MKINLPTHFFDQFSLNLDHIWNEEYLFRLADMSTLKERSRLRRSASAKLGWKTRRRKTK